MTTTSRVSSGWWPWLLPAAVALIVSGCHFYGISTTLVADPVGSRLFVAGGADEHVIRVVDTRMRQTVATIPLDAQPDGIAVNPASGQLYVGMGEAVSIFDTTSNELLAKVTVGADVEGLAVNAAGTRLFVLHGHPDGVAVIDAGRHRVIRTFDLEATERTVFHVMIAIPGTDLLYLARYIAGPEGEMGSATLSLLDVEAQSVGVSMELGAVIPIALAVDPSWTRLYVLGAEDFSEQSWAGRLLTIETGAHRVVTNQPTAGSPIRLVINPSGTRLYIVHREGGSLTVMGAPSATVLARLPVGGAPTAVAVDPGTGEVYISHGNGSLTVVNANGNSILATIPP